MVDNRPAILIAEDQIFIALEAERILEEAFDCTVENCRRDKLSNVLGEKKFDIVILELSGNRTEDAHNALLARQAGSQVVFLTAGNHLADVEEAFPDVPLIMKPFSDFDVRVFVERLLMSSESS